MDIQIYSPVEQIHLPLFEEKQIQVFVKRDDMIHPFISGNKWRKLKYVLKAAVDQKKTHLVTFGGAWSNHLLATACAAARFGLKSTAFVRGEQVSNPVLDLCAMFGMELRFTSREIYLHKQALFLENYPESPNAFFIDEGGASAEAVQGCSELVDELPDTYNHIFCACGTGTTAAGIIKGIANKELHSHFHGISALKNGEFLRAEIEQFLHSPIDFSLHTDYHFGGYAKTTPALMHFINQFASSTGILLDPIYTGKMMYSIIDLVEKNTFNPGEKILAIHTGGLLGLLGKIS